MINDGQNDFDTMYRGWLQQNCCLHCRLFQEGDFLAAANVLAEVDTCSTDLFSPALRAHQLLLWAQLWFQQVSLVVPASTESADLCVKALCACDWAKALAPASWRQVSIISAWV